MPHLVQFDYPQAGRPASDNLRTYVFMANLASQESTGDVAASVSVERVLNRLLGSMESDALLFGLMDSPPDASLPLSPLGFPLIASSGEDAPYYGFHGFFSLSIPKLEDRDTLECECTLDVEYQPLPGEELSTEGLKIYGQLLDGIELLAKRLARPSIHLWTHHAALTAPHDSQEAALLRRRGYQEGLTQLYSVLEVPELDAPAGLIQERFRVELIHDYNISPVYLEDILQLYSQASIEIPHGRLELQKAHWTPQRLSHAQARLRDRNGRHLIAALIDDDGSVIGLSEFSSHLGSMPEVAEHGITFIRQDLRHRGLGRALLLYGLTALRQVWAPLSRIYATSNSEATAMNAIYSSFQAKPLGSAVIWINRLD